MSTELANSVRARPGGARPKENDAVESEMDRGNDLAELAWCGVNC